ncbi:esterase B1-like isoform X2 [Diachasmimorpha longicaudata]|uniref:esterase B1-like isoform X2 n=1 Tax=Diachasmimorpha longicaudata TaxID=58733 RepID=UPI0030B8893B
MDNLQVEIDTGKLKGSKETSVSGREYVAFKGIPYAEPPVGELRFEDPRPPLKWTGVREATNFGDNCAHIDPIIRGITGSDDCLYLNVYTTSIHPQIPKAVMVWIHGGAFVLGSGDDTLYGPDYLIDKDIVLVTINYRVGILGFLNLESAIASGNQGLKDQVFALQWVKRNIDRFGGDSGNVTIFGESAGGASVHYLTISPLAQGLFQKAIIQSGSAINPWARVPGSPKRYAIQLAALLGKETDDPAELLRFLKSVDARELIQAQAKIPTKDDKLHFLNPFGPGVDALSKDPFLPIPPEEAIKSGIKVPCMIGYMNDEGLLALGGIYTDIDGGTPSRIGPERFTEIDENYQTLLVHPIAAKLYQERNFSLADIRRIYFGNEKISMETVQKFVELQGDAQFLCGIHDVLDIQVKTSKSPTYLYKLDCDMGMSQIKLFMNITLPGTCHGDELALLFCAKIFQKFGAEPPDTSGVQQLLIQRFTEMWTNFAKTGNPTPSTSQLLPVVWTPVTKLHEYECLKITDSLEMIKEHNIYQRMRSNLKNKL